MGGRRGRPVGFVRRPGRGGLVQRAAGPGWVGQDVFETVLRSRIGEALGFVRSAAMGVFGRAAGRGARHIHKRRRRCGQLRHFGRGGGIGARLGLERLERLERAPELGHGSAAVAHQGLEAAGAVAVADQRHADAGVLPAALLEQLDLHAVGARQAPGGHRDAARQHHLKRAHRRELVHEGRLERLKLDAILVRQHHVSQGAHAMPQGILRRARLARGRLRPARLGAVPATGFGTGIGHGNGRAKRGADTRHGGIPSSWQWGAGRDWPSARAGGRRRDSLAESRNIVQHGHGGGADRYSGDGSQWLVNHRSLTSCSGWSMRPWESVSARRGSAWSGGPRAGMSCRAKLMRTSRSSPNQA